MGPNHSHSSWLQKYYVALCFSFVEEDKKWPFSFPLPQFRMPSPTFQKSSRSTSVWRRTRTILSTILAFEFLPSRAAPLLFILCTFDGCRQSYPSLTFGRSASWWRRKQGVREYFAPGIEKEERWISSLLEEEDSSSRKTMWRETKGVVAIEWKIRSSSSTEDILLAKGSDV